MKNLLDKRHKRLRRIADCITEIQRGNKKGLGENFFYCHNKKEQKKEVIVIGVYCRKHIQ